MIFVFYAAGIPGSIDSVGLCIMMSLPGFLASLRSHNLLLEVHECVVLMRTVETVLF